MSDPVTKEDLEKLETRLMNNFNALVGPVKNTGILNKTTLEQNKAILTRHEDQLDAAKKLMDDFAADLNKIRQDAIKNSVAVAVGRVAEQIRQLIEYKKGAEQRINQRYNGETQTRPPSQTKTIDWRSFGEGKKGEWAFRTDRSGKELPEVVELVRSIRMAGGKVTQGGYSYRLSGDNDKFIQRFPAGR